MVAKHMIVGAVLVGVPLVLAQARASVADNGVVYVGILPSDVGIAPASAFARSLRLALERHGIRSVSGPEGAQASAPEAITNASNVAGAQVSIGIRLVASSSPCVTVRAPAPVPFPKAEPTTQQGLGAWVKQTTLAERSRDSKHLATELRHLGQPCASRPHWVSSYFLKEASGASVVLELSAGATQSSVEPMVDTIVSFVGGRGRRTRS